VQKTSDQPSADGVGAPVHKRRACASESGLIRMRAPAEHACTALCMRAHSIPCCARTLCTHAHSSPCCVRMLCTHAHSSRAPCSPRTHSAKGPPAVQTSQLLPKVRSTMPSHARASSNCPCSAHLDLSFNWPVCAHVDQWLANPH